MHQSESCALSLPLNSAHIHTRTNTSTFERTCLYGCVWEYGMGAASSAATYDSIAYVCCYFELNCCCECICCCCCLRESFPILRTIPFFFLHTKSAAITMCMHITIYRSKWLLAILLISLALGLSFERSTLCFDMVFPLNTVWDWLLMFMCVYQLRAVFQTRSFV